MRKFLKFLLLVALLAATGFGSYKGVIAIWGEDEITELTESPQGNGSTEVKGDDVKNMLVTAYYYDDYTKGYINYAAVRFFNVNTKECTYIFFPGTTKVNMSSDVYKVIYNASSNVKQSCQLSDIANCFVHDEDRYGYTTMALEDVIGTDIDCYESITSDNVISIVNLVNPISFDVPKKMKFKDDSNIPVSLSKGVQQLMGDQVKGMLTKEELYDSEAERLSTSMGYIQSYLCAVANLEDREEQAAYYIDYYNLLVSDTSYQKMCPYLVYLYQVQPSDMKFIVAAGTYGKGDVYTLNYSSIQATVKSIMATVTADASAEATTEQVTTEAATTEATTEAASEDASGEVTTEEDTTEEATTEEATTEEEKSTKDLKIEIYNSTTVNGLAAKWKNKLAGDGYNITNVDTERSYHLDTTKIIVTSEGMAEDLKDYFPDAEFEVSELSNADVRIVIGKDATSVN